MAATNGIVRNAINNAWKSYPSKNVSVFEQAAKKSTMSPVLSTQAEAIDGSNGRKYSVGANSQNFQRQASSDISGIRNIHHQYDVAAAAYENLYMSSSRSSHKVGVKSKDASRTGYEAWDVLPLWSVP